MRGFSFTTILKNYTLLKDLNKVFIRQSSRTVLSDKSTPLTEHTLLGRMLLYLNNNSNKQYEDCIQSHRNRMIDSLIHGKTSGLRNLNIDQIASLFYSANTSIFSHNTRNLRKVLDLLDIECCLRINSMDPQNILKLLRAFMHVAPNRITQYKFYQYAIDNIDKCLNEISKKELLQFIFYIGLQKKGKKSQMVLKKCLKVINKNLLDSLTTEDLCIICNATYRSNTIINNMRILEKVKQTLNENLNLLKDPALLVTLVKTLKHNHYQDEDLLTTISCTIFFNKTVQYYTFTAICHILSLYADHLYYDEELLKLLSDKGIKQLQESGPIKSKGTYLTKQIRAKDITTFMWALSVLCYTSVDEKLLDSIVPKIKQRIYFGEYKTIPNELIDCVLFMWIMNYRAKDLVFHALCQENVAHIREEGRPSNQLRLNLLLTSIEHEEPQLFKELRVKPLAIAAFNANAHIQNRPLLQRVFRILNTLLPRLELEKVEMNSQIPNLNIVGISAYKADTKKAVNIEVLDEYTCIKNRDCHPAGFMQLKLRILEQLDDVPLVTISQSEIESMNDSELREFLEEEIKLFC